MPGNICRGVTSASPPLYCIAFEICDCYFCSLLEGCACRVKVQFNCVNPGVSICTIELGYIHSSWFYCRCCSFVVQCREVKFVSCVAVPSVQHLIWVLFLLQFSLDIGCICCRCYNSRCYMNILWLHSQSEDDDREFWGFHPNSAPCRSHHAESGWPSVSEVLAVV